MAQQEQANDDVFQTYMWVVAHPDDAEFSSAGTIAHLAGQGRHIVIVQVTSGDYGSSKRDARPEDVAATREAEEQEAARRLGVAEVVFLRCSDGRLTPDLDLREKIVRLVRTHRPDVVVTHDPFRPYALHPDHRAVGMATHDAVYPTARDHMNFPEHLAAGLEPHKTAEIWYFGAEQPDHHVDITDSFDAKIDALKAHRSQVGEAESLAERLRERAEEVAAEQPFELGEAFKVVKMRR